MSRDGERPAPDEKPIGPVAEFATIRASDGRLSAFAYPLVRQIPIYTDVIVPGAGGCLAAQAVFHAGVHALATAATSCRLP